MSNNPKIVYNSVTLNFPKAVRGYDPKFTTERNIAFAGDGTPEIINQYEKIIIEITLNRFDSAFRRDLEGFLSWARQGNTFAFAFDRDKTVNTTLDGAAAAAQKVIPLTSTTGCTAGELYRIKNSTGQCELIEIDTISAGVSVTAVDNLVFSYASGDTFIDEDYWPELIAIETGYPVLNSGATTYNWNARFQEI